MQPPSKFCPPTREQADLARRIASCKHYLTLLEQAAAGRHYQRARDLQGGVLASFTQIAWGLNRCEEGDRRRLQDALDFAEGVADGGR